MASGRLYDSDNEDMSRASMNTEAWKGRIMGFQAAVQARKQRQKDDGEEEPKGKEDSAAASDPMSVDAVNKSPDAPPPPASDAGDAGARTA